MKNTRRYPFKKVIAKGDRLQWDSLEKVRSVALTPDLIKGKQLTPKDLEKRAKNDNADLLVP